MIIVHGFQPLTIITKSSILDVAEALDPPLVKTPQHLDSFCLSSTEIISKDNLPVQVEEIILDDTEQCQQNTHFITS